MYYSRPRRPKSVNDAYLFQSYGLYCRYLTERSESELQIDYNPKKSYTPEYQAYITSKVLRYDRKSNEEMGVFIKALQKIVPNPQYVPVSLKDWKKRFPFKHSVGPVTGRYPSNPDIIESCGLYFERVRTLRKNAQGIVKAPSAPQCSPINTTPPTPRPASRELPKEPDELIIDTPLTKAIQESLTSMTYLSRAGRSFQDFVSRCETRSPDLLMSNPNSGLQQMVGFAEHMNMVISHAYAGSAMFGKTITFGLNSASKFLRSPNALISLIDSKVNDLDKLVPTQEMVNIAKVQIQVGVDNAINAYERVGKPGSQGGWSSYRGHNPDMISPIEIQSIIVDIINGFLALRACCLASQDLLRAFVYSDKVEKSYMLHHVETVSKQRVQTLLDGMHKLCQNIISIYWEIFQLNKHTEKIISELRPQPIVETEPAPAKLRGQVLKRKTTEGKSSMVVREKVQNDMEKTSDSSNQTKSGKPKRKIVRKVKRYRPAPIAESSGARYSGLWSAKDEMFEFGLCPILEENEIDSAAETTKDDQLEFDETKHQDSTKNANSSDLKDLVQLPVETEASLTVTEHDQFKTQTEAVTTKPKMKTNTAAELTKKTLIEIEQIMIEIKAETSKTECEETATAIPEIEIETAKPEIPVEVVQNEIETAKTSTKLLGQLTSNLLIYPGPFDRPPPTPLEWSKQTVSSNKGEGRQKYDLPEEIQDVGIISPPHTST